MKGGSKGGGEVAIDNKKRLSPQEKTEKKGGKSFGRWGPNWKKGLGKGTVMRNPTNFGGAPTGEGKKGLTGQDDGERSVRGTSFKR